MLSRDGVVEEELLEVMRVVLGDLGRRDESNLAMHENRGRCVNLELDVLGTLGQMMEDKLVKVQSAPNPSGITGKIRDEVRRMCEVYRRGESVPLGRDAIEFGRADEY